MSLLRRILIPASAVVMLLVSCMLLVGCGEPVAATYKGGQVLEEDVTQTIETMRTSYGLEDEDKWNEFVTTRAYKTQGDTSSMTAVEKAAYQAPNAVHEDEDLGPGTLEDMRAYVIEQIIRSELIEQEIKNRNYQISDEEVDAYVDQMRTYIESMTMEGIFESYIQAQYGMRMEDFRESVREQLKQLKLQNDVSALAEQDGDAVSGKAAWNIWFENLYNNANVKINPFPDGQVYNVIDTGATEDEEGVE